MQFWNKSKQEVIKTERTLMFPVRSNDARLLWENKPTYFKGN